MKCSKIAGVGYIVSNHCSVISSHYLLSWHTTGLLFAHILHLVAYIDEISQFRSNYRFI